MKKRLLALFFCAAVLLSLAVPPVRAEESVFFTAMGESILPLRDESMPFLSGSSIYIPAGIFTGAVRKSLEVSYTRNDTQNLVILYRGSHSLWLDLSTDYARDEEEMVYYPGAIERGGQVYVSASLVARFFDLRYTITEVPHGYMVWLRKQDYPLSDTRFADAASYIMESRYKEYLKSKEQPAVPVTPPAAEPDETVMDGKRVYLCLRADENLSAMLDTLDHAGIQAAVFFTPEEMARSGGVLRRMTATGHSVGILAEGEVLEQAAAANDALKEAACTRTRLVMAPGAPEEVLREAEEAGYRLVTPDMDRTQYGLRTADQAKTLVRRISERRGNVVVWLGTEATPVGLRSFLTAVAQAEGRCRALTETV